MTNLAAEVSRFEDEAEFRAWYLRLPKPEDQLDALAAWRARQSKVVGSLGPIIGHLAGEQYSQVDHFFLELLQNADDNQYAPGVSPELTIRLQPDHCSFACNEVGFSAENVFAICYAAASTKRREPGTRSFIGEKGIGFKSLFAVAEVVEVHSGNYHFELRDKEFIIPHRLVGSPEKGSRIVVRFKPHMANVAQLLSARLTTLSQRADQFVLFLQKLEALKVEDAVANSTNSARIVRHGDRCLVEQGSTTRTYKLVSILIEFSEEIVRTRFEHISGALVRDVCFAIPEPTELPQEFVGQLFCFLPTRVRSGFPFHVQVDGQTTTNRENVESSAKSKWNELLWEKLPHLVLRLYLTLRDDPAFADALPQYFPQTEPPRTGNDDLNGCIAEVVQRLRMQQLGRNRKGEFSPLSSLRLAPNPIREWVETDQFAKHLGPGCEFVADSWKQYARVLRNYGCNELSTAEVCRLLAAGGTPDGLGESPEEQEARRFLECWMELERPPKWEGHHLRTAPVYPLKCGPLRSWGPISEATMLVSSDAREISVPDGISTIDPAFTYTPGGNADDAIKDFNENFRTFLIGSLNLKRYSETVYLADFWLPGIKRQCARPITTREQFLEHTELWLEIYYRIWWRQKTIIGDSSEERFRGMLDQIRECPICVQVNGTASWQTQPLCAVSIPKSWWSDAMLAEAYAGAGRAMAHIPLAEVHSAFVRKRQIREATPDEHDWKQFLTRCGANEGPTLVTVPLPLPNEEFPKLETLRHAVEAVDSRGRLKTVTTVDFDSATVELLQQSHPPESLTVEISKLWKAISSKRTLITWYYYGSRTQEVNESAARCRITDRLKISTDLGATTPDLAVIDSPDARLCAQGLVPMVDPTRYSAAEFLLHLGVAEKVDEEWLMERAQDAITAETDERFISAATVVIRVASRMVTHHAEARNWVRTARIFAHSVTRELLPYDDWVASAGEKLYPDDAVDEALVAFETVSQSRADQIVEDLFKIGDLAGQSGDLLAWFRRISGSVPIAEQMNVIFARTLREVGLHFGGRNARTRDELPLVWDRLPDPNSATGFVLLSNDPTQRAAEANGARMMNWPCAAQHQMSAWFTGAEELDTITALQIQLTAETLAASFSHSKASTPNQSTAFQLACDGRLTLRAVSELSLQIVGSNESPEVDCWFEGTSVLYRKDRLSVHEAFAAIVDSQASTTIAPFIGPIFFSKASEAKAANEKRAKKILPTQAKNERDSSGNDSPSRPVDEGSSNGDNPDAPEQSKGSGGGNSTAPQKQDTTGKRKRLYSYVVPDPNSDSDSEKRESGERSKHNEKVELAGERLLKEFCEKRNLQWRDLTNQNVGYDFELSTPAGVFYVELKSSTHEWKDWENSVTPNELLAASKHRTNYVLCIAERVGDARSNLIFIQDPWGHADGFLFDSPWKKMASDPGVLFSIEEQIEGAPPPRDTAD